MTTQLTKPQAKLLREVCKQSCYVADYYPPAVALIRVGLCEWRGTHLQATAKGKATIRNGGKVK